jgi:GGDEF domain-containing protein
VGLTEGTPVAIWVAAAIGLAALIALALDVWGGALVGLSASALVVLARERSHLWSPAMFGPALIETLTIVVVAALAGYTGSRLRTPRVDRADTTATVAEYQSLGLLSASGALARLEEESARTQRHRRSLELALLDVEFIDDSLPFEGRRAALRTVARIVGSRTPDLDVPFAIGRKRLGIIFPEPVGGRVWETVSSVLDSVAEAQFAFQEKRQPRPLAEVLQLFVGLATHSNSRPTAEALLDAATRALERARQEEEVGPR